VLLSSHNTKTMMLAAKGCVEGKKCSRIVDGGFLEFVDDSRNLEYISGEVDSRTFL
jgi:hypothetical protein